MRKFYKKIISLVLALAILACGIVGIAYGSAAKDETVPGGIYRGAFTDPKQVEVEFGIKGSSD